MTERRTVVRALWALIGITTLLRLAFAASMGGYTNEAYYEMYAQNLDWSYFDHPPMVGVVSAVGLSLGSWVSPIFGLRFGFVMMFAGSTWLIARLASRFYGERTGVLAAVLLNATVFYGVMVGMLAGPDGPLLFFWLLTLERLSATLDAPERTSTWVAMGAAWGAAMLSKYHAVLLPAGFGLYLLLRPQARRCLKMPGPYLAILTGIVIFSPVIFWNATHGWASFAFQGTRAGGFHGFDPEMFVEALVAQFLYLLPWVWLGLIIVLARLIRKGPLGWSDSEAFLMSQAIPALGLFMGVATFRRIMPHWPLVGFLPLMVLLARTWSERYAARTSREWTRFGTALLIPPALLAFLFLVHANYGVFQDRQGRLLGLVSPKKDPTVDTVRWDQLASALEQRGLLDEPNSYLFTNSWRLSAELAMATNHKRPVACFHRDARSFTFWSKPQDWVGRDGIFIRVDEGQGEVDYYNPWFSRLEPLASVPIVRGGVTMETIQVYRCVRQTDPFAFGFSGPEALFPTPPPRIALETR